MSDNTAMAVIVIAVCMVVTSCFMSPATKPDDPLTGCLRRCWSDACLRTCGEVVGKSREMCNAPR